MLTLTDSAGTVVSTIVARATTTDTAGLRIQQGGEDRSRQARDDGHGCEHIRVAEPAIHGRSGAAARRRCGSARRQRAAPRLQPAPARGFGLRSGGQGRLHPHSALVPIGAPTPAIKAGCDFDQRVV